MKIQRVYDDIRASEKDPDQVYNMVSYSSQYLYFYYLMVILQSYNSDASTALFVP